MARHLVGTCLTLILACFTVSSGFRCYVCERENCDAATVSSLSECGPNVGHCFKQYNSWGSNVITVRGCGKVKGSKNTTMVGDHNCIYALYQSPLEEIPFHSISCNCKSDSCNTAAPGTKTSIMTAGLSVVVLVLLRKR
ncbi:hypothetical protein BV898_08333 [Hypsibius exemplaris]|uniref:Protein sleepless n=1 Tax=Hypsibius exemplaris TaxID=2072580 RepID=A0A1W0WQV4_HYPEX|nr:hypothetical protein BV898_08333 [Hypsibius exemplaris]